MIYKEGFSILFCSCCSFWGGDLLFICSVGRDHLYFFLSSGLNLSILLFFYFLYIILFIIFISFFVFILFFLHFIRSFIFISFVHFSSFHSFIFLHFIRSFIFISFVHFFFISFVHLSVFSSLFYFFLHFIRSFLPKWDFWLLFNVSLFIFFFHSVVFFHSIFIFFFSVLFSFNPVGWSSRICWMHLCKGIRYNSKWSDGVCFAITSRPTLTQRASTC